MLTRTHEIIHWTQWLRICILTWINQHHYANVRHSNISRGSYQTVWNLVFIIHVYAHDFNTRFGVPIYIYIWHCLLLLERSVSLLIVGKSSGWFRAVWELLVGLAFAMLIWYQLYLIFYVPCQYKIQAFYPESYLCNVYGINNENFYLQHEYSNEQVSCWIIVSQL